MKVLVLFFFILGCGHNKLVHKPIPWNTPSPGDLTELKYLDVDENVTQHSTEKRGFVSVPLNYQLQNNEKINIFYRFIPCIGCRSTNDRKKPIMVVINDGPGRSSESLRSYEATAEKKDDLHFFLKEYHILLIDQRGTGYSSPIDLDNSDLKPELLAHYFDSDEVSKDTAQVIRAVLKKRPFHLLGIGYGGLVLYRYLFENFAPKPKSYVFANSSIPPYSFLKKYRSQRLHQVQLNYQMQRTYPEFRGNIQKLKDRLREEELNPHVVNSLYNQMGEISTEDWKSSTHKNLKKLLKMENSELEDYFSDSEKGPHLLRYILEARSFTPKMTRRTLNKYFQRKIPMRSWMLNGFWEGSYLGEMEGSWKADWIRRVDKFPPPSSKFANLRQLSNKFQHTSALFVFGRKDKSSETQYRRRELKWFKSPRVQVVEVPGSGGFVFENGGVQLIKRILNRK